ncbi:mechanosensitive ion channel family protein [Mesorhizobium sp. 10J20-29]
MDIERIAGDVAGWVEQQIVELSQPWSLYQLAMIAVLFLAAKLLAGRVEGRLEERARRIKGHQGLLRVVVALMRRTKWIVFVGLLFVTLTILRATTWPSRSYLISIALSLALAWLTVSVLSRVIRNRLVARVISVLAWTYAALVILGLNDEVAAFLDGLAVQLGDIRLTVLMAIKAFLLLSGTIWLAIVSGNYFDERLQQSEELTPSIRVLIGKIVKIGLVIFAGAAALSMVGVDLTALTVLSGAIGVGLGFGLQKVVSNFISGVIILLDKSIKPGDTITLGETFGWIRELRARFVSVVTRDGREYLIPNEDFITQQVINWSFSDDHVRLDIHFGVSYDSDPHLVSKIAIKAAMGVARVDADRKPVCWLTAFGDSSLDFVLRFWIHDPQQGLTNVRGKVLLALWDTFKEHGVKIPYPHREVIMRREAGD